MIDFENVIKHNQDALDILVKENEFVTKKEIEYKKINSMIEEDAEEVRAKEESIRRKLEENKKLIAKIQKDC